MRLCAASFSGLLLCVLLLSAGGCDTSVDPYAETELAYSVFGYLDVMADTQWVRVEPLQDSVFTGTEPFEASVTTTNLATDETVLWQRKVFDLNPDPEIDLFVQNYWTDAEIAPTASYRFTAEGEAGTSTAEVTTPPDFPAPTATGRAVVPLPSPPSAASPVIVTARGIERLGAVVAAYRVQVCTLTGCYDRSGAFSHLADTTRLADGTYRIVVEWTEDVLNLAPPGVTNIAAIYSFQVTVASVSEDWPNHDFPVSDPGDSAPPQPPVAGLESNIENGVGFLGGAVTKTVEVPITEH